MTTSAPPSTMPSQRLRDPNKPDFTMLIGPDTSARLLEVGVIETGDQDYVIHAMAARSKYLAMIDPTRGEQQ